MPSRPWRVWTSSSEFGSWHAVSGMAYGSEAAAERAAYKLWPTGRTTLYDRVGVGHVEGSSVRQLDERPR